MNNYMNEDMNYMNEDKIVCYDCHTVISFTEDDVIDGYYVTCPCCGEHVVIL